MAVLKQIKFGSTSTPIAKSVVAINANSTNALSVVATNDQLTDNFDPTYTIALAVDGQTITMPSGGLKTALALKYEAATTGEGAHGARIVLADQNGASGYNALSSVNVEDIVGSGIVQGSAYDPSTGVLTITWAGSTQESPKTTQIDLGALLDIQDIVIDSNSTDFLSFAAVSPAPGTDAGQAQIGVKLADVTYSATSGNTPASLTVDTTNGKILDASDAIPAIASYVQDVLDNASANLEVTAEGDNYVSAAQDENDNKNIVVATNVTNLTATAGTPGTYGTDGTQTTAPTAGTLSGTANSLGDAADIAAKVKTYVDGAIAIEAARSDAKNLADIAALDFADTAVTGQYVSEVDETDGVVSVQRVDVSAAPLNNYAKSASAPASTAIAATDTINQAINKLEWALSDTTVRYNVDGTTLVVAGVTLDNTLTA